MVFAADAEVASQPRASAGWRPAALHPRAGMSSKKSPRCARGWSVTPRGESGYVVLLLLTGLPPFMMADALVLLLGVTPALGTVSPTSCKDGSRYMATGDRTETRPWLGTGMLCPRFCTLEPPAWTEITPSTQEPEQGRNFQCKPHTLLPP